MHFCHCHRVIRIGFLNDKVEERKDLYLDMFDVVLLATDEGPAGMDYAIRLLQHIARDGQVTQ